ncbi:MAG TPA: cytochrome P450 [Verrucomicrobiae bacterium]|nr:cytochrome P450 [Verrucomicrobiae bacterium]
MNSSFISRIESIITSPHFIADPYPTLHKLRAEAPVYWSDAIGGWILTKYDDIMASFKDTEAFSNENRLGRAVEYLPPEKRDKFTIFRNHYATKGLLHSDPPDHTRFRSLVTKEFTPAVVEKMKPRIQDVVVGLLDTMQNSKAMDVVSQFASPLPVGIIAEILGVPPSDRYLFKKWANEMLAFQGVNKPNEADLFRAQNALQEMRPYIRKMIEDRRRIPRSDLISKFVAAEMTGERLSEDELINTCVTLFVAGHETTVSLIGNTIYLLLSNPDQLKLLRENSALLAQAIEESLRYESPVSRQSRYMKADAELGGKHLQKGQMVFQMLNAANRDPAHFTDPDKFDVKREDNRHIAFGFGEHFCIGAKLARTEALIAIGTVIEQLPHLRLADPKPDWDIEKRNSRVLKSLRVTWS